MPDHPRLHLCTGRPGACQTIDDAHLVPDRSCDLRCRLVPQASKESRGECVRCSYRGRLTLPSCSSLMKCSMAAAVSVMSSRRASWISVHLRHMVQSTKSRTRGRTCDCSDRSRPRTPPCITHLRTQTSTKASTVLHSHIPRRRKSTPKFASHVHPDSCHTSHKQTHPSRSTGRSSHDLPFFPPAFAVLAAAGAGVVPVLAIASDPPIDSRIFDLDPAKVRSDPHQG